MADATTEPKVAAETEAEPKVAEVPAAAVAAAATVS
jgi:hypothetical protein